MDEVGEDPGFPGIGIDAGYQGSVPENLVSAGLHGWEIKAVTEQPAGHDGRGGAFYFLFPCTRSVEKQFDLFIEQLYIAGHWLIIQVKGKQGRIEQGLGHRVDFLAEDQAHQQLVV